MLPLMGSIIVSIAVWEMLGCIGTRKKLYCIIPSIAVGAAFPWLARYAEGQERFFVLAFFIFFIYIFFMLCAAVFSKGKLDAGEAAITSLMTVYITFGITAIILLRDLQFGKYIYLLAFLVPWMSDTFAYFVGISIGRHKLIPDVSPKKSVEGAIGGIVFGGLSVALYGFIIGQIFNVRPVYLDLILIGSVVSMISQFGDLIASLVKRKYGIKDYGKILPGHGGLLDRFDSIISTAPFLYILLTLVPFFKMFY